SLFACQQRALWQFFEYCRKLLRRERPVVVTPLGQELTRGDESNGTCALAADLLKHGVIVARADAEISRNYLPFVLFRQNPGKKAAALPSGEVFFSERQ